MSVKRNSVRRLLGGGAVVLCLAAAPVIAQNLTPADEALVEIEALFGGVPTFVGMLPQAAIPGAWALTRDLELGVTALDAKTKALIGLAVAAQIPCTYCIWSDTEAARAAGATEEEIREAVVMAGLTRLWSTVFNGFQLDFETFMWELGGPATQ